MASMTRASTGSRPDRCLRMCLLTLGPREGVRLLLLAARAIISGALALRERLDCHAAAPAGSALALVDVQALAEVARGAVRPEVVTQRRAAGADRKLEHGAHRAHQARGFRARERRGAPLRLQARAEQRFARVDVADPDHEMAVHQELLQRHAPPAADAPQVVRIEGARKGLGREVLQQRMLARIASGVDEAAEAARVVEAQREA